MFNKIYSKKPSEETKLRVYIYTEYTKIFFFTTLISGVKPMRYAVFIYVISQDIFKKTYQNVVFRYYILTLALYTVRIASLNTFGIKCIIV